jgi:pre-rRNA-processing protein TSR4
MDIDAGEGGSSGDMDVKDAFESSMDKAFQRFADRMSQNPEQILRYEFAGSPLLYSKVDPVGKLLAPHQESAAAANVKVKTASAGKSGMPKCVNCGGDRLFELQLTPYAIVELEAEELGLEGMEWGTIILGVCSKDCVQRGQREGEVGYVEEWVGVQWEELNKK